MQGEWNAKEKRSFYFHFRAAAYLGRSQSSARREKRKEKPRFSFLVRAAAGQDIHVETRCIASLRGGLHLRLKAVSSHPLRCFLTRRIDFFRAAALLLANTRKSERLDFQAHPSNTLPQRRQKMVFSPLYGTFRPHFSSEKWPWIEISIPWIGESMGWKWISMGCFGQGAAWTGGNLAKRRTTVGVRFNGLP